jgi:diaminohydroxyphosphoribosylaminopyrimidine deaminase / 5-amino-6-(5-phosphoribosylamino)uracil reductase
MKAAESRDPHEVFLPFAQGTPERPFVAAQLGQSLDGRIATPSGDSKYINGPAALDHLHRMRAHVDAVVVGIGTVLADDPQLTVRRIPGRDPVRVVIDPRGRLPVGARCGPANGTPCLLICREDAPARPGIEAIRLPASDGLLCPRAIVAALGRQGFARILIEGGARTVSTFIEARSVDRLHLLIAPVLIGSGKIGLELKPIEALSQALRPPAQAHLLGDGEVLVDCDLRATQTEDRGR